MPTKNRIANKQTNKQTKKMMFLAIAKQILKFLKQDRKQN